MHIKCLRRGKGSAQAAVDYLVGERDAEGYRREGVELYLRRPDGAAVLRLEVDPESYWLYTSSALDAEERARAVERHGLARALEVLASRDDPTPTPNARS